jgi:hypothetical protein
MPKRAFQILAAVLVVAVLGVATSVAPSSASSSTASASTLLGYPHCDDDGPWSRWSHDWWHHRDGYRYWHGWGDGDGYFGGHSYYGGCPGFGSVAQGAQAARVDHVMVAAKRLRGSRCQHLYRSGRLGKVRSCGRTHWMRADGVDDWRFDIPRRLPSGRYRLHRRAIDTDGKRERPHLFHLRIR